MAEDTTLQSTCTHSILIVSGLTTDLSHDILHGILENEKQYDGGEIMKLQIDKENETALVRFESPIVATRLCKKGHLLFDSTQLSFRKADYDDFLRFSPPDRTIHVAGLPDMCSEDAVFFFFENEKSSFGGDIDDLFVSPPLALIIFESAEVVMRLLKRKIVQYELMSLLISQPDYSGLVAETEPNGFVLITEIIEEITKSKLLKFFKHPKTTGNYEIENAAYNATEQYAIILYKDYKVAERVIKKKRYKLGDMWLTVSAWEGTMEDFLEECFNENLASTPSLKQEIPDSDREVDRNSNQHNSSSSEPTLEHHKGVDDTEQHKRPPRARGNSARRRNMRRGKRNEPVDQRPPHDERWHSEFNVRGGRGRRSVPPLMNLRYGNRSRGRGRGAYPEGDRETMQHYEQPPDIPYNPRYPEYHGRRLGHPPRRGRPYYYRPEGERETRQPYEEPAYYPYDPRYSDYPEHPGRHFGRPPRRGRPYYNKPEGPFSELCQPSIPLLPTPQTQTGEEDHTQDSHSDVTTDSPSRRQRNKRAKRKKKLNGEQPLGENNEEDQDSDSSTTHAHGGHEELDKDKKGRPTSKSAKQTESPDVAGDSDGTNIAMVTGFKSELSKSTITNLLKLIKKKTPRLVKYELHNDNHLVILWFQEATQVLPLYETMDGVDYIVDPVDPLYMEWAEKTSSIQYQPVVHGVSADHVKLLFESDRVCKGGPVNNVVIDDVTNKTTVTFKSPKAIQRILEKREILIETEMVTVSLMKPSDLPLAIAGPYEKNRILVKGLHSSWDREKLEGHLKQHGFRVEVVKPGMRPNTAMVSFLQKVDYMELCRWCAHAPFQGVMLSVERVATPNSILVSPVGNILEDTFSLYFENTSRSGGGPVKYVKIYKDINFVVIGFSTWQVVSRVLKKTHTLEDQKLTVVPLYENVHTANMSSKSTGPMSKDPEVLDSARDSKTEVASAAKDNCFEKTLQPCYIQLLKAALFDERMMIKYSGCKTVFTANQVTFSGSLDDVTGVKQELFCFLNNMCEYQLKMTESLMSLCKTPETESILYEKIKQCKINAVWENTGKSLKLFACTKYEISEAKRIFDETVTETKIVLTEALQVALLGDDWSNLKHSLHKKHLGKLLINGDSGKRVVIVTAQKDIADNIRKEITDFLERNSLIEMELKVSKKVCKFIEMHCQQELASIETKAVRKPLFLYRTEEGYSIQSTRQGLDNAELDLQKLIKSIITGSHKISKPGMPKIFYEEKGTSFLKNLERSGTVLIDVPMISKVSVKSGRQYGIKVGGISIYVAKGNLTAYPVEVIVNAANKDLRHLGGIAGAILKAGGSLIQDFCVDYVQRNGKLKTSDNIASPAGKLPYKYIIHAVGPMWKDGSDKRKDKLSRTVDGCLHRATELNATKLGLPLISSGVFGFPVAVSAAIIVKSISTFIKSGTPTTLQEIHIVDTADDAVLHATKALRAQYGKDEIKGTQQFSVDVPAKPVIAEGNVFTDIPRPTVHSPSLIATIPDTKHTRVYANGVRMTVIKGNIATEQVDIIVNSTEKLLRLSSAGAVSKTISKLGGPLLQQECQMQYPDGVGVGDVAETSGGQLQCKRVYHAVCPQWDQGARPSEQILRKLISSCLRRANDDGHHSIALPLLGTGGLHFPRDLAASVMMDEIQTFSRGNGAQGNLREIRIVAYDDDTFKMLGKSPTISPVTNTSRLSPTARVSDGDNGIKSARLGRCFIQIKQGDLIAESTEAIVNSTNEKLALSGALSKSIARAAGNTLSTECAQPGLMRHGVAVTGAGNLPFKHVIHVCSKSVDGYGDVVSRVLQEADRKLQLTSISFPALATGGRKCSVDDIANVMVKAVVNYCQTDNQNIKQINFCIFENHMITAFTRALAKYVTQNQGIDPDLQATNWIPESPTNEPLLTDNGVPKNLSSVELDICAKSYEAIFKVKDAINKFCEKECHTKTVSDPLIAKLSQEQVNYIREKGKKYGFNVQFSKSTIVLEGDAKDLLSIIDEIHQILGHIREGELLKANTVKLNVEAQWSHEDCNFHEDGDLSFLSTGSKFVPYKASENAHIERAFLSGQPSVEWTDSAGNRHTITFSNMEECCYNNMDRSQSSNFAYSLMHGQQLFPDFHTFSRLRQRMTELKRRVERSITDPGGCDLPSNWSPVDPKEIFKMVLLQGGSEYNAVTARMQKDLGACNIVQIERVQNPTLHGQYELKKKQMVKPGERILWHGTSEDYINKINANGFNRSLAGKHATAYGQGVYFAVNARYSCSSTYAKPDARGQKRIYQCKVLTGEYTRGHSSMVQPPVKDARSPHILYDSVVDNEGNPQMFVIFSDSSCYPEYLITFK